MRRRESVNLAEALKDWLKANNLEIKCKEVALCENVDTILGTYISSFITNKYIKNKVLYVSISSTVARKELSLIKSSLIDKFNKSVGEDEVIITDIVFR